MNDRDVEQLIDTFFDENYRRLLVDGGAHVLTPRALAQARQQVEHYWKKMREIAVSVTDTEVRLQLPNQKTPKGRTFVIEGVVDLVREADRIRMYDLKTHHRDEVVRHLDSYAAQLNVYAYIWRELRGQRLDEMGVIAVRLPEALRRAIAERDDRRIAIELERWNPLVPIDADEGAIQRFFEEIAQTVDCIEEGRFSPRPIADLRSTPYMDDGRPVAFATVHCRNCDGRFSCESYRTYVEGTKGRRRGARWDLSEYLSTARDDGEGDEWLNESFATDIEELYGPPRAPLAASGGKDSRRGTARRRKP